jgi:hypothetical protein
MRGRQRLWLLPRHDEFDLDGRPHTAAILELRQLGVKRLLLALLRSEIERRIAVAVGIDSRSSSRGTTSLGSLVPWAKTASSLASAEAPANSRWRYRATGSCTGAEAGAGPGNTTTRVPTLTLP